MVGDRITCCRCKEDKMPYEFNPSSFNRRHSRICRDCSKKASREYYSSKKKEWTMGLDCSSWGYEGAKD